MQDSNSPFMLCISCMSLYAISHSVLRMLNKLQTCPTCRAKNPYCIQRETGQRPIEPFPRIDTNAVYNSVMNSGNSVQNQAKSESSEEVYLFFVILS